MTKFLDSADAQPVTMEDMRHKAKAELQRFIDIRTQVFELMEEADDLAKIIRLKSTD